MPFKHQGQTGLSTVPFFFFFLSIDTKLQLLKIQKQDPVRG